MSEGRKKSTQQNQKVFQTETDRARRRISASPIGFHWSADLPVVFERLLPGGGCRVAFLHTARKVRHNAKDALDQHQLPAVMHLVLFHR